MVLRAREQGSGARWGTEQGKVLLETQRTPAVASASAAMVQSPLTLGLFPLLLPLLPPPLPHGLLTHQ